MSDLRNVVRHIAQRGNGFVVQHYLTNALKLLYCYHRATKGRINMKPNEMYALEMKLLDEVAREKFSWNKLVKMITLSAIANRN